MSARNNERILVGDVGGTHARFAVVDMSKTEWTIESRRDLEGDFVTFESALQSYLERSGIAELPRSTAIAVAGPVTDGQVQFTNRNWSISEVELCRFGFAHSLLINDFAALAFAVRSLHSDDVHRIGPQLKGLTDQPVSVIGAGTGFGAACLARFRGRAIPISTEGGHAGFAPGNELEASTYKILAARFGHVSIERVLSGPGITNLYTALLQIAGRQGSLLSAAEIVALRETDEYCRAAIGLFCAIYGSVAGDIALMQGARGGVYLAGGIAQKLETAIGGSEFRQRFEAKGRLSGYVRAIPTYLIVNEDMAFVGAAQASIELRSDE